MEPNIANTILDSLNRGLFSAAAFLPNFIAGIVILLIGTVLGSIFKRIVIAFLNALKIETYLRKYGVPEAKNEFNWVNILAEIARWFVIVLFLIPTAEIWGLPQITHILNTFLLYLPNVFVAAIIGLVGLVFARLAADVVLASTRSLSPDASRTIASVVRVAITIFVLLAVLNQLGVAQDLIRILFTGFVAMIALAGGIAFGLGGQDTARTLLESIRKKIK
jgi:small-conductance mechanosensitive channel